MSLCEKYLVVICLLNSITHWFILNCIRTLLISLVSLINNSIASNIFSTSSTIYCLNNSSRLDLTSKLFLYINNFATNNLNPFNKLSKLSLVNSHHFINIKILGRTWFKVQNCWIRMLVIFLSY